MKKFFNSPIGVCLITIVSFFVGWLSTMWLGPQGLIFVPIYMAGLILFLFKYNKDEDEKVTPTVTSCNKPNDGGTFCCGDCAVPSAESKV